MEEFLKLVEIDSPSGEEKEIAHYIKETLQQQGVKVEEDAAGNLLARLPGDPGMPVLMIGAHMDTVPARGVKGVIKEGAIYSEGDTILGADDKAAIAGLLSLVRKLREAREAHPPLELVFTVGEEVGLKGAKAFDVGRLQARMGFVLDSAGELGSMVVQAPVQNQMEVFITGRAAHAGINPEEGISAIKVAARAVAEMRLGRIDAETTANIGRIEGGEARNIVPERVYIMGEARSLVRAKLDAQTQHMEECFRKAAEEAGAGVEIKVELLYPEFCLKPDAPVVQLAREAALSLGLTPRLEKSGGGSDANIFNSRGLPTVNLGIGMRQVHTRQEHIYIRDLELIPELLMAICRAATKKKGGREMKLEETTLGSCRVFEGKIINLRVDEVELPNGKRATREVVEHPGAVAVAALTEKGEIVLVRQFRKPAEEVLLEIPAGKLDPGEKPLDCVRRELMEETGITAECIKPLLSYYTTPGFSNEVIHLFLATGLRRGEAAPDKDEFLEVTYLPLSEALRLVREGKIRDAKTIIGILLAADRVL